MAIHAHFGEAGFPVWDEWSGKSHKYDAKDLVRVWRSFRHKGLDGVGAGTLFKIIAEHGGTAACAPDLSKPLPPVLLNQVVAETEKRSSLRNIPCVFAGHLRLAFNNQRVVSPRYLCCRCSGHRQRHYWPAVRQRRGQLDRADDGCVWPVRRWQNYIQVGAERLLLAAGLDAALLVISTRTRRQSMARCAMRRPICVSRMNLARTSMRRERTTTPTRLPCSRR